MQLRTVIYNRRAGEAMDFESIYKEYFREVYAFIFKLSRIPEIAEDITQETFIKALRFAG